MAGAGTFREDMRAQLRDRLLDAARAITTADGWSALTMGAVAGRAGISRQHLYNEIGTKQDLGDALISRETDGRHGIVNQLYEAVVDGHRPWADGAWGKATVEVLLAVLASARERRELFLSHQVPLPS